MVVVVRWTEVVQADAAAAAAAAGDDDTLAGLVVEEDLGTWRSKTTVVLGGDIVGDDDVDEAAAEAAERRPVVPARARIAHGLVVVEEEPHAEDDAGNDAAGVPPGEVHRRTGEVHDECAAEPAAGAWNY